MSFPGLVVRRDEQKNVTCEIESLTTDDFARR